MEAFANYNFYEPVVEKIAFYADNKYYRNKLFTFKVINYFAAYNLLIHFHEAGNHIRSCYIKGYQRNAEEFILFQQSVSQDFISILNSGFNVDYAKFFLSIT